MNPSEIIGYISAIIMGLSLGVIGGGGSILTVPILVYFFKQDALLATMGSLFVVGSVALIGAVLRARRGLVDFKTGLLFALPSFFGVFFSRKLLLPSIPDKWSIGSILITKSMLVLLSFAIIMVLASRAMILSGRKTNKIANGYVQHGTLSINLRGFFIGCLTGFVGAGGGFLIIPALVLLLGMPMQTAIGTSLAIVAANSLFGFAISLSNYVVSWELLLSITFLGILGLVIGQSIVSSFDDNRLKQIFGYFVLIIGFVILLQQLL